MMTVRHSFYPLHIHIVLLFDPFHALKLSFTMNLLRETKEKAFLLLLEKQKTYIMLQLWSHCSADIWEHDIDMLWSINHRPRGSYTRKHQMKRSCTNFGVDKSSHLLSLLPLISEKPSQLLGCWTLWHRQKWPCSQCSVYKKHLSACICFIPV